MAGSGTMLRGGVVADAVLAGVLVLGALLLPLVFSTRFEDVFAFPKATALRGIVVVALVPLGLRFALSGLRGTFAPSRIDFAVIAFVALNIAAFVTSIDRSQSLFGERLQWQGLLTILLYVGSFYLARIGFKSEHRVALLYTAAAVAGVVTAGYALAQRAGLDPIWDFLPGDRVFSTLGQPNWLAAYLVLAVPITASLAWRLRGVARLAVIAATAAMVSGLALTLSRAGYLGLMAATIVLALPLARWRGMRWTRVRLGAIAAAAIVAIAVSLGPVREIAGEVWDRAWSSTDLGSASTREHLALWEVGIEIALDYPLLGAGQETYPELFDRYRDEVLDPYRAESLRPFRPESPHNVYIATAAGSGFPSLLAYLAVVVGFSAAAIQAVRKTVRGENAKRRGGNRTVGSWRRIALLAALAAVAGHLVTDGFMTAEIAGSWLFWVLMGTGVGLAQAEPETLEAGS